MLYEVVKQESAVWTVPFVVPQLVRTQQNHTKCLLFCRIRMAAGKSFFFSIFMLKRPLEITQTDTHKIYPSLKLLQYDYIL